jgi:hypothetical protein
MPPPFVAEQHILMIKPTHAGMFWNNLFVGVWRGPASPQGANDFGEMFRQAAEQAPRYGTVLIFEPSTPLPDAEARQALVEVMDKAPDYLFLAGVIESRGMLPSTLRGVLRVMGMISEKKYPQQTFPTVEFFADWAQGRLNAHLPRAEQLTAPDIVEVIRLFRLEFR